jgi:Ca2+-binding RTX toxin-like protein
VIVAGPGRDTVYAGPGNDYVDTGRGKDRIYGEEDDDTMRAGAGGDLLYGASGVDSIGGQTGRDQIYGADGDDVLDGGPGGDTVRGETGADTLKGDSGGDTMLGGPEDDRLYGELQDDRLYGEDGDDVLVGDQGIDRHDGGPGADWMRGGTNQDVYDGGSGADTVSFATATPPGPTGAITGVQVDLPRGFVKGDGGEDTVRGTENVLGSPYDDDMIGTGGAADGLLGSGDECAGFSSIQRCPAGGSYAQPSGQRTHVHLEGGPDPGLIVTPRKGSADETIAISTAGGGFAVTGSGPFDAGAGCQESGGQVTCASPGVPLGYVAAFGGDGNDRISVGPGFPDTTTVDLDGGNGNDRLEGAGNNDNLYAGEFGEDVLIGNGGGDSLVSEVGRDLLSGGSGNDNLATSDPCSGHVFDGGTGAADVAGFGRTYYDAIEARLGGTAVKRGKPGCTPTKLGNNLEVLEGTRFNDVLIARTPKNLLIGREGKDICIGGRHKSC